MIISLYLTLAEGVAQADSIPQFDFKLDLFGPPSTLSLTLVSINKPTGQVTVNGVDTQQPTTPFLFDWRDGTTTSGFFPQTHTYRDNTQNYIIAVTAHYPGGATDSAEILVRFAAPQVTPISLPPDITVTIPNHEIVLSSRILGYGIPGNLTYIDDTFFGIIPRTVSEYVLTVAASI